MLITTAGFNVNPETPSHGKGGYFCENKENLTRKISPKM